MRFIIAAVKLLSLPALMFVLLAPVYHSGIAQRPGGAATMMPPARTTPVGATIGNTNPQSQPTTQGTASALTIEITLQNPSVQSAMTTARAQQLPATVVAFVAWRQRAQIALEQFSTVQRLSLAPINARLIARSSDARNTITVQIQEESLARVQTLANVQAVRRVTPPRQSLEATPFSPSNITPRPSNNPGYPVVTAEAR
jgi:hypothetical protein